MAELYSLFNSWFMVGWLLGAGFMLRCGAWVFDALIPELKWLIDFLNLHFQKKKSRS